MKRQINNNIFFFCCLFFTIILILIRDLLFLNIPFLVFTIICLFSSFILNQENRFIYLLSLLPFCKGLPYSEMILFVLFVDFIFELKKKQRFINIIDVVSIIGLLIIELINYVHYNILSNAIFYLIIYMFLVSYVVNKNIIKIMRKKLIVTFSISVIIAVCSIAIREIIVFGLDYIIAYNLRFGANIKNMTGTSFNSNELGLYCVVACSLLLLLFKNQNKKTFLILAAICSALGMLSVSRTFIALIILVWMLFIIASKIKIKYILFSTVAIVIVFLISYFFNNEFIVWLFDFSKNRTVSESILNVDRIELLNLYNYYTFSNVRSIVMGYSQKYMTILNTEVAVHNALQEVFVCWGLIGFIISFMWIFNLVKLQIKNSMKFKISYLLPFLVFIVYVQTIQLFTMNSYLIIMLITIISAGINTENCR